MRQQEMMLDRTRKASTKMGKVTKVRSVFYVVCVCLHVLPVLPVSTDLFVSDGKISVVRYIH